MPRKRRSRDGQQTRLALIRAAERLFATRGVDAVSLREVSAAARQRNNSAVRYHFKSRAGLIDAILERHADPIQQRYSAQLDLLERQGPLTLPVILNVLVRPLVAKLDDPDGGAHFVSISAQLSVNPALPLTMRPAASSTPGVIRLMSALFPLISVPPELVMLRQERFASSLYASIVGHGRAMGGAPADPVQRELFIHDLVDSLIALLASAPSPETLAWLAKLQA